MCTSLVPEDPEGTQERIRQHQVFAVPRLKGPLCRGLQAGLSSRQAVCGACASRTLIHITIGGVTAPPGDVLIHVGDLTMCGASFEVEAAACLRTCTDTYPYTCMCMHMAPHLPVAMPIPMARAQHPDQKPPGA